MTTRTKSTNLELPEFRIRTVQVAIEGISPLIVHKFSEKSQKMIEDKQQGKAKNAKHPARSSEEEFQAAKHISPLGFEGFPAAGFKAGMIRGAKMIGLVMKDTQTAFFIKADCEETQLVEIKGEARMRTDHVKIGINGADIRYRPEYPKWEVKLTIEFNEGILSVDQIYQLVIAAGYGCGIGEMRPEKGKFNFGRYKIKGN